MLRPPAPLRTETVRAPGGSASRHFVNRKS
jgi:hypothetical protein